MDATSRRFLLRQKTRPAHDRVDALVGSFDSAEAYRHYLAGLLRFREPLEAAVADLDLPPGLSGWRPGRIAGLLRADCADLAVPPPPAAAPPAEAPAPSALFGMLYVLEGASLGAQLLLRRAAALGFTEGYGARHLAGQTAAPDRWRRFIAAFDAAEEIDIDAATAAANRTFAAAEQAFGGAR